MFETAKKLLFEQGIDLCAPIALSDCTVKKPYLLEQKQISPQGSAVMFAIPYHTPSCEAGNRNLSRYAVGYDYHLFVEALSNTILPKLKSRFPTAHFALFADHSPIDEREAAAKAGLGILGRHGLLITKPYSSYVFLGEIVTDLPLPPNKYTVHKIEQCENCGACLSACPLALGRIGSCLSSITQKKGVLSSQEEHAITSYGSVWGCDICQESCPHTLAAAKRGTLSSPIPFFHEETLPHVTYDGICKMSDQAFSKRAFSWRGREVILRNLAIMEKKRDKKESEETDTKAP